MTEHLTFGIGHWTTACAIAMTGAFVHHLATALAEFSTQPKGRRRISIYRFGSLLFLGSAIAVTPAESATVIYAGGLTAIAGALLAFFGFTRAIGGRRPLSEKDTSKRKRRAP